MPNNDDFPSPPGCTPIPVTDVTPEMEAKVNQVMDWITEGINNTTHPLPDKVSRITMTVEFSDGITMVIDGSSFASILNRHTGPIN